MRHHLFRDTFYDTRNTLKRKEILNYNLHNPDRIFNNFSLV